MPNQFITNAVTDGSTALTLYVGRGDDGADAWTSMAPGERKLAVMKALSTRDVPTLLSLAEAWTRTFGKAGAHVAKSTIVNQRIGIRQLLTAWAREDLIHPSPDAAALWVRSMERNGYAPLTIQGKVSAARNLYASVRWACTMQIDPFADLRLPRDKTAPWEKRQPYTPNEMDALLATSKAHCDTVLVLLAGHGGLRAKECCDLKWADLNFVEKRLTVKCGKGRKQRRVAMSATLIEALRACPHEAEEYVLPFRAPASAWRHMKMLCLAAGVTPKGVHSLRHTAGTRMYKETGNLDASARHLGHASIETARIYSKWSDTALNDTVASW